MRSLASTTQIFVSGAGPSGLESDISRDWKQERQAWATLGLRLGQPMR
jgi:hypothetical protein